MIEKAKTVSRSAKTHRSRFARIDNAPLQDRSLSFRARGVLAFILSMPDTWCHSADSLATSTEGEGRDALRAALRELAERGYATLCRARGDSGHVVSTWTFREKPAPENQAAVDDSPKTENQAAEPGPEKPATGEPAPGRPESGAPGFGHSGPYKTTHSETTISETTNKETTGAAARPSPRVAFPWRNVADLPRPLADVLAAAFPDSVAQSRTLTTIRGREIRFNGRHSVDDWAAVLISAIADEQRSAAPPPHIAVVQNPEPAPGWQAILDAHFTGPLVTGGERCRPWAEHSAGDRADIKAALRGIAANQSKGTAA